MIASRPSRGPAAVCRASSRFNLEPGKTLVPDRDAQIGRLGDHRRVGAPAADQRVGADAGVLLVHDAATISRPAASPSPRDDARRVDHRGHAAFHVLRSAAVEAAVALDRIERRPTCPRRRPYRCGRRTSATARGARPSSTPITLGRPGATSCNSTSRPIARSWSAIARGNRRLTRRARHQRRIDRIDRDEITTA